MSRTRLLTLIVAAALVAGASIDVSAAIAAVPSPVSGLRAAANGTWTGPFGTLVFHGDGTATFTVKECGFSPVRPGFVKVYTDCAPDVAAGRLDVRTGGYGLATPDGTERAFAAYVERGRLHLGFGVVAHLDRDRRGTVAIAPGEHLRVGDGRCRYTREASGGAPLDRPCRFVRVRRRVVLEYQAPDPFSDGKIGRTGLVYLPHSRLLVSAELVERPFTRGAA